MELASTLVSRSKEIDDLIDHLPGLHRTYEYVDQSNSAPSPTTHADAHRHRPAPTPTQPPPRAPSRRPLRPRVCQSREQTAEIEQLEQRRSLADERGRNELEQSEALLRHVRWAVDTLADRADVRVIAPPPPGGETAQSPRPPPLDEGASDGAGAPSWLVSAVAAAATPGDATPEQPS